MALQIKAFSNCNDAFIVWRSPEQINDCIGFELWRIQNGQKTIVNNRVSFTSGTPDLKSPTPSNLSPLRRYTWTDHANKPGDKVAYQVVPVVAPGSSQGVPDASLGSSISNSVMIA